MKDVFITATGSFLPGSPIPNDEMEQYLGFIQGKPSRTRQRILKSNQIQTRYYAIDKNQNVLYRNSEMAAFAIEDALKNSEISKNEIELLSVATTVPDILVPGFGSMVHGELKNPTCEINTAQGVCASSLMALKNAYLQIKTGEKKNAVVSGSEFASRAFRHKRFDSQELIQKEGLPGFDTDFLRWMLSDGAGAVVMQNRPASRGFSFKVEWVEQKSHAHQFDVCMYMGGSKDGMTGQIKRSWLEFENEKEANDAGAFNLKQDIQMLDNVVKIGVDHLFDLIERNKVNPEGIDWMLCHYSSHFFKEKIHALLVKAGLVIPEEKWFTNLYTKGNTGSASIFIMLDEFAKTQKLKHGQQVVCVVPESGRFISSIMLLTVVEGGVV